MTSAGYQSSGLLSAVSPGAEIQVTGESPLRVGCISIVGAALWKVKKDRSFRPAEKQTGIADRFPTVGMCALGGVRDLFFCVGVVQVWYKSVF